MNKELKEILDKNAINICYNNMFFVIPKDFNSYLATYKNPKVTNEIINKSLEEYIEKYHTVKENI
jgi:hypothetical protein